MSSQLKLSRCEFLKLTGNAMSAVALKASTPIFPIETTTPTNIPPVMPTRTTVPTSTLAPTPTARQDESLFPDMVLIEAGGFQMGSIMDGYPDQQPIHAVNISKPFYIAKMNWVCTI